MVNIKEENIIKKETWHLDQVLDIPVPMYLHKGEDEKHYITMFCKNSAYKTIEYNGNTTENEKIQEEMKKIIDDNYDDLLYYYFHTNKFHCG